VVFQWKEQHTGMYSDTTRWRKEWTRRRRASHETMRIRTRYITHSSINQSISQPMSLHETHMDKNRSTFPGGLCETGNTASIDLWRQSSAAVII